MPTISTDPSNCPPPNQITTEICTNQNDTACFFTLVDPTRNGVVNTKQQVRPHKSFYRLRCSRYEKLKPLYEMADQSSNECENAMDMTALS